MKVAMLTITTSLSIYLDSTLAREALKDKIANNHDRNSFSYHLEEVPLKKS